MIVKKATGSVFPGNTTCIQVKVYWISLFQRQQPVIDGDIGGQPLILKLVLLVWIITAEYTERMNLSSRNHLFIYFCRCVIEAMKAVKHGEATRDGENGADYVLFTQGKLPDYYITRAEAIASG